MIRTFKINVNAATPNVPLEAFRLYQHSAMLLTILNVPRAVVALKARVTSMTDGAKREYAATREGSAWRVVIPAANFAAVGTATRGIHIFGVDGADPANEYDIGAGDVVVLDANGTVSPTPPPPDVGDMKYADFADLDEDESSLGDVIRKLKHAGAAVALACALALPAFGAIEVQTARLGSLPAKTLVVTNITGDVTGIGASDATNIAAAVVVRDVPAWAREAEPPQTGVDAETATNIAEAVVERHEREGGAAWNRTGYWVLDYCVVPDTVDASRVYYSTNDSFQVFSNAEAAVVYGTSAVMRQTPLDRYAPEISPVEGYQCLTPGGTMDGARLLASSGGVYRVSATALDGSVRYSDVLLTADRRDEKVVSTYVADVTQERNLTASWAKTICDLAQKVRTYSVGGREVEEWSTALAPFCLKGSGNSSPFAVSAHVLASAAHYPQYLRYLGTQTFADGGTNVTVRKTAWINLKDWALTNGWSEADIAAMPGAADIAFVTLADETSLPNACTPSFLTAAARDELFGSMAGVAAWQGSQYQDYANPVVMLSNTAWTSGDYRGKMRADVATSRERLGGGLAWVRTGDSGKPVWIYPDVPQLPVVVAHTSTTAGGADWCAALPIIKAFVESRGDTLKIWR